MFWYVIDGAQSGKRYGKSNSRKWVMIMARKAATENDEEVTVSAVDSSEEEVEQGPSVTIRPGDPGYGRVVGI